jgi:uncharacterized membrane protein
VNAGSALIESLGLPVWRGAFSLASLTVGPVQFESPVWLWLIPASAVLVLWWGRSTLSGLGTATRRLALVVRLLVIALLAGAMAEPQWRKESKKVAVMFVLDASRSVPQKWQRDSEEYVERARKENDRKEDELGVITVAEDAYVQSLPSKLNQRVERQYVGPDQGTNLGQGVRLAMAVKRPDSGYRLVLISDGNETAGGLLAAAEAARAIGVPIDVLAVRYNFENEVMVDSVISPSTARMGENINVKIVVTATRPSQGRLHLQLNGQPIDLDPDSPSLGKVVGLDRGPNVLSVPVTIPRAGPQEFTATFEPLADAQGRPGDSIAENNTAAAVTFVSSEGRVLVVTESSEAVEPLVAALTAAKINAEVVNANQSPRGLTELNGYDAIILADEPAYEFSQQAQEDLKQYVHETGGGLVMIGGPNSFGAGGWIGSPLEEALPLRLDPPQKRQMPRGALVVVSHSIEMPDGVSWGKKTAQAAVDALSRLDLAGIVEYDPRRGGAFASWVHPISEIGDGSAIRRSINNLQFGDMPDYNAPLNLALQGLVAVQAGAKHVIMITDGDASPPTPALLQKYKKERVTISTVGVYPHNPGDLRKLADIALTTGGNHYEVTSQGGLGKIVQIFIKEAQTVKRSLIWEGDPFIPAMTNIPAETMRGIGGVPPLSGYVVTGEREGLAITTLKGKENDPISAQWQYGLGRVVAFTSDASPRWCPAWVGWPGYKAFWEQHLRWAMRPTGSANLRVTTEKVGDQTRVIVDALDPSGERLNFAKFAGRIATPDGKGQAVELQQVGPGRYEGRFDSRVSGSYVVSLRYAAPRSDGNGITEGSVQAAVTRPFADEFRALTDNLPLLQQVASMTGGRVLTGDPKGDDLWRRDGLKMPVAMVPIWLTFAIGGVGLFLVDVGVRRVRVDVRALRAALARGLKARKERAGQQMDALRQARESARAAMAQRAREAEAGPAGQTAAAVAKTKFEASADRVGRREGGPVALGGESKAGGPAVIVKKAKPEPAKEEGLDRLMQAKKRAREEME